MVKTMFFLCLGMLRKSNEFEAHTQMTKTPAHRILQSSATAESLRHRGFAGTPPTWASHPEPQGGPMQEQHLIRVASLSP